MMTRQNSHASEGCYFFILQYFRHVFFPNIGLCLQGLCFRGLCFRGLRFRGLCFRGLCFRGLRFRGLRFRGLCFRGLRFRGLSLTDRLLFIDLSKSTFGYRDNWQQTVPKQRITREIEKAN